MSGPTAVVTCLAVLSLACGSPPVTAEITVTPREDQVEVRIEGELFTSLRLVGSEDAAHLPYLHPVIGPDGQPMTRAWPLSSDDPREEQDHPHHLSLWFAHGSVNGLDFWHGKDGVRIVHDRVISHESGSSGELRTANHWLDGSGEIVATDERTHRFERGEGWRSIDVTVTVTGADRELLWGDTKEGSFAVRVAPELRVTGEHATATLSNRKQVENREAWGQRSEWILNQGTIGGRPVGVALFDHPDNLRYPTWWHARTYGLLAANPFGVHDFEQKEPGTGNYTQPRGEALTLRYRVELYDGHRTKDEVDVAFVRFGRSE